MVRAATKISTLVQKKKGLENYLTMEITIEGKNGMNDEKWGR